MFGVACLTVALAFAAGPAVSQVQPAGTVDPLFRPITGRGVSVRAILPLPDGRIAIGGYFTSASGLGRRHLAILRPDGSVDTSFQPSDRLYEMVTTLGLAPDGRLMAATHDPGACGSFEVIRFNDDGSVDARVTSKGLYVGAAVPGAQVQCPVYTPGGRVVQLAAQQDGRVLVATTGDVHRIDSVTWGWDPRGSSAMTFSSLSQRADGRIAVVCRSQVPKLSQGAWLGADGSIEQVLDPANAGWDEYTAVAVQPDGKLLFGAGRLETSNWSRGVVRLHPDGAVDDSFAQMERFPGWISSLAVDAEGGVVVVAHYSEQGKLHWLVSRLLPDGERDPFFAAVSGGSPDGTMTSAATTRDGVVLGGYFASWSGERHEGLVRIDRLGHADPGFKPQAMGGGGASLLAAAPDGGAWVVGNRAYVNGVLVSGLARLDRDGALETVRGPENGPNEPPSDGLLLPDGRLLITGPFTTYGSLARAGIARLLPNGALDMSFVPDTRLAVTSARILLPRPDGSVVLASPKGIVVSGVPTPIVRILSDGAIGPGYEGSSWLVGRSFKDPAIQPDGKLVLQPGHSTSPIPWTGPVRVGLDGTLDSSFRPKLYLSDVEGLLAQSDGRVVAIGSFREEWDSDVLGIVRFQPDGSIDPEFPNHGYPTPSARVAALQANDRILISTWRWGFGHVRRLMSDGAPDPSFVALDVGAFRMVVHGDTLFIQGDFSSVGGLPQPHLAKVSLQPKATSKRRMLPALLDKPEAGPYLRW